MSSRKTAKYRARPRALYAAKKAAGRLPKRLTPEERAHQAMDTATWRAQERPHWEKPTRSTWRLRKKPPK
jgi:hypothetical protein